MITRRKVVLATEKRMKFLERFEAIKYIDKISEIHEVWSNNKTPVMLKDEKELFKILDYNVIEIPNGIIGNIEKFTEFCHITGFECGEYRNGETFDSKLERCFLCEVANHKGFEDLVTYNKFVDKPVDCIIYESEKFYVVSELGALKQGYLMIVPKKHILSVAQFPQEYWNEYFEVCKDVESILKGAFNGKMVIFMEHGSGPSGKTSHKKSIVHAHTHCVVDFTLKKKYKKMVKLQPCNDISEAREVHYFSYQEGTEGQLMLSMNPEVYIQRQFPRQVMAEEFGLAPEQYNWRLYDFEELTDATLFHVNEYLKRETNARILERTEGFRKGFSLRSKKI